MRLDLIRCFYNKIASERAGALICALKLFVEVGLSLYVTSVELFMDFCYTGVEESRILIGFP